MRSKLWTARFVQTGFWVSGVMILLAVYSRGMDDIYFWLIGAIGALFTNWAVFGLKCERCGVSYFYDSLWKSWNITGIDIGTPVKPYCKKCGFPFDEPPES